MEKNILYVDDDENTRCLVKDVLTEGGYSVSTAEDGSDGLDKIQKTRKPYDLIITGIFMGDMNGDEMISIIRKNNIDTPILVISGGGYDRGCELVKESLVSACLPKPFNTNDLLNMVKILISDTLGAC